MSPLSRRQLLGVGGAALGTGLAGCSSLGSDGESGTVPTRLSELQVGNRDPHPYTVYVLLVEDGDPRYWNVMDVEAHEDDGSPLPGGEFEGYPTDAGEYALYAWRDDQPRSEWRRYDFREHDAECVNATILVGWEDDRTGRVRLLTSTGCPA